MRSLVADNSVALSALSYQGSFRRSLKRSTLLLVSTVICSNEGYISMGTHAHLGSCTKLDQDNSCKSWIRSEHPQISSSPNSSMQMH